MKENVCAICGNDIEGWGNNPEPVVNRTGARCCDDCNINVVIPARMEEMMNGKSVGGNNEIYGKRG